ncbi:FecR family protein [Fulvivirga ligni]|uniref:FecR family protein n=1 Tax=Fulvivirga ligni TaxID=2904246 RepID=UPI001F216076|nr:FecR domain-containing protein [Fulvivirga ligni]UII20868.1 FecR domain-containing protein [Fulvivirga ligni]
MNEKELKQLLQDYIDGTISPGDERRLELFESRLILNNLDQLNQNEEAKQKINHKLSNAIQKGRSTRKLFSSSVKIAASLLILSVVGFIFFLTRDKTNVKHQEIAWIEKTTPMGAKLSVTLPDGTRVKLNAGSSLRFPEVFAGNERLVEMQGEAFFDVVKNKAKPFIIKSGEVETRVVGTSFNIQAYQEQKEVIISVLTGKVMVSAASHQISLVPQEQGIYNKEISQISKGNVDIEKVLYWKEGILFFHDLPLEEVAHELERWYGVDISIEGEELKSCHLTATYQDVSLTNILKSIRHTKKGVEYSLTGDYLILSGVCNE